ncbi:MAG: hypothetical protein DRI95_08820 [Bacteroidetes bacterium]|nr:MAG: hypothetical protein DRI95_08820 [Bacteroidota bacterium]
MEIKKLLLFVTSLVMYTTIAAQEMPKYEMQPYRDSINKLYWNKHQEVFISLSTTKDGKKENLESEISSEYDNPFFFDTEGLNFIRSHWAVDKNTKKPIVPQKELLWEVYADGKAPFTKSSFSAVPKFFTSDKQIYGKDLTIALSAKDAVSGVQITNYSLNGAAYIQYNKPIILDKEGKYSLKYFSVDNVGNIEEFTGKTFYIDITPPVTNSTISGVNIEKGNIISLQTKIYFNPTDEVSGVAKTFYSVDGGKQILYNGKNISLIALKDGEHIIKFYSVDKVQNKEDVQIFEFYLDRTAPITASDILGDRFIVGEQIYFSGRTKLKLTAVDNKSGVKDVLYSVDGGGFIPYADPFYLPSKQGLHIVKYYAIDNTQNVTKGEDLGTNYKEFKLNVDKIYVDLTGPSLNHSILGNKFYARDTVFIGPKTKIKLVAKDGESGLNYISYSIDNIQKETKYDEPFSVDVSSGLHKIEYFGYDNVNNRNVGQFLIFMDNEGPVINYKFSIVNIGKQNGLEVYPSYASMFITIQDQLTGVTKIYYSLNGKPEVLYRNYIKGFQKNKVNTLKVRAFDKLNNITIMEIKFYIK